MSRTLIAAVLVSSSCTPDVLTPTGAGGAGSTSTTGAISSSSTTPSSASGATSGSSMSVSTGSSGSTGSSSAADSSSASSSVSTGSAMPATFPRCTNTTDSFDGYTSDMNFQQIGEGTGPWSEYPGGSAVIWQNDSITLTGGSAVALFLKAKADPSTMPPCAYTLRLVDSPNGSLDFGLFGSPVLQTIQHSGDKLRAFGGGPVNVTLPVNLALIVDGGKLYGAYASDIGVSWTLLPPTSGVAIDAKTATNATVTITESNGTATVDDFNGPEPPPLLLVP